MVACPYSCGVIVLAPITEDRVMNSPPPYDPQLGELFNWHNSRRRRKDVGSPTESNDTTTSVSTATSPMSPMNSLVMTDTDLLDSSAPGPYEKVDGLQAWEDFFVGWNRQDSAVDLAGLKLDDGRGCNTRQSYSTEQGYRTAPNDNTAQGDDMRRNYDAGLEYNTGLQYSTGLECSAGEAYNSGGQRHNPGQVPVKKVRRSWLAYQTTRSEMAHSSS